MAEKFYECQELFKKFESKGDSLNPEIKHVLGFILGKLCEIHNDMHSEVVDLVNNIDKNIVKPLKEYQVLIK